MGILDPPAYRKPSGGIPRTDFDTATQSRITNSLQKNDLIFNVKDYGASTSSSDNTAAIQATINAADSAGGGIVWFPPGGVYRTGGLTTKSNVGFMGGGYDLTYSGRGSRISLINGANSSLFTVPWGTVNNWWRDLHLEGNNANQSNTSWGIYYAFNPSNSSPQVYQQAVVYRCAVKGFLTGGVYVGKWNEGVDVISSFIADNAGHGIQIETSDCQVSLCHILANGGDGVRLGNGACRVSDNPSIAGNKRGVVVVSGGSDTVEFSQGTYVGGHVISDNHVDINAQHGIYIQGQANMITGNWIGSNSTSADGSFANVYIDRYLSDGTTTATNNSVPTNTFSYKGGISTRPSYHILIANYGATTTYIDLVGNTYDISTNAVKNGVAVNDWQVLGTQNIGVISGNRFIAPTASSAGVTAPTVSAGAGAGTSPPAPTVSNANDVRGQLFCGSGTSPSAGAIVSLVFNKQYRAVPIVTITPGNSATATLTAYVTPTATGFTIYTVSIPNASQANGTYQWYYQVIG